MAADRILRTKMVLDDTQMKKGLSNMQKTIKGVGASLVAAFSIQAIAAFTRASVRAWDEQEKANKRLLVSLKGNVGAQQMLIKQANVLQRTTLFSDDEIVNAQSLLSIMTKDEQVIKRLIPLVLDFATAKGMDLAQATELINKAVIGSGKAFKQMGYQLEGAAGSSQRLDSVISQLSQSVGGQAVSAAEAGAAAFQQLSKAWDELLESFGRKIGGTTTNPAGEITSLVYAMSGMVDKFKLDLPTIGKYVIGLRAPWLTVYNIVKSIGTELREQAKLMADAAGQTWALNEDQKEVANIQMRLMMNGMGQTDAYRKARELLRLQLVKERAAVYDNTEEWQKYSERISALSDAPISEHVETLGTLEDTLKELQEEFKNASLAEAASIAKDILAVEKKIEKYKELLKVVEKFTPETVGTMPSKGTPGEIPIASGPESVSAMDVLHGEGFIATNPSVFRKEINLMSAFTDKYDEMTLSIQEKSKIMAESISTAMVSIGTAMSVAIGEMIDGEKSMTEIMADLLKSILMTIIQAIAGYFAQAIAASIAAGAASGGPAAPATAAAYGAAVAGIFTAMVPAITKSFAEGGIVSGPVNALVGEYPGARSNPEVIAPLDKLQAIMGGGRMEVYGVLRGRDIYLSNKKQTQYMGKNG